MSSASAADGIEELKERVRTFAEEVGKASGLDVDVAVLAEDRDSITVGFEGPDARFFVGRHGQALDALQHLAVSACCRRGSQRLHITFDADGYRARREATLQRLARELADQVKATGQEAVLDPLSPLERRIVHTTLVDDPGVTTYSEGEEPERYIIISPKA